MVESSNSEEEKILMDAYSIMKFEIGAPVLKAAGWREVRGARRLN